MARSLIFAAVGAVVLLCGPVQASDPQGGAPGFKAPAAAPFTWTGFYVGAHIGGGWSRNEHFDPTGGNFLPLGVGLSVEANDFIAGGQIGFNYQFGNWVVGIEGDYSRTRMADSIVNPIFAGGGQMTHRIEIDWVATVTGRIGYARDRWLTYAKGGVAWADNTYTATFINIVPPLPFSAQATPTGWTVGVGIEVAMSGNWSARIEYDYLDLGKQTVTMPSIPAFPVQVDQRIQIIKFGASYRFAN